MPNQKDDRCTRYDGPETIGDVIAPTLNDAALEDCERVLRRFEAVAIDEMDDVPAWLVTAHSVVRRLREHSDRELSGSWLGPVDRSDEALEGAIRAATAGEKPGRAYCGAYHVNKTEEAVEIYELTEVRD